MAKPTPPELLEAGAIYTSTEFKARLRLGEAGWRRLKAQGLRTFRIAKTVLVRTEDLSDFLSKQHEMED